MTTMAMMFFHNYNNYSVILLLLLLLSGVLPCEGFSWYSTIPISKTTSRITYHHHQHSSRSTSSALFPFTVRHSSCLVALKSSSDDASTTDQLLKAIDISDTARINELVKDLEDSFRGDSDANNDDNDLSRFDSLLDLYDVRYVVKSKDSDNPVGGKWTRKNGFAQRLLKTRRTFQHLLPVNSTGLASTTSTTASALAPVAVAEAVNVISLDALFGFVRVNVILRGDAVPLTQFERSNNTIPVSNLAVRALFDPPRIVFGKRGKIININIGPTSSVVLDTTYFDKQIRIGMGGTSGTRFVFERCRNPGDDNDTEANEFRSLLAQKPVRKIKAVSVLGAWTVTGLYLGLKRTATPILLRTLGSVGAVLGAIGLALVGSSGGIERDDVSYRAGKEAAKEEERTRKTNIIQVIYNAVRGGSR